MSTAPWPNGTATGIGSLPGTDPAEASAVVLGELPDLPHLPELPGRGLGADMIGRTAALLVDIAVELVPSGYRVTRPGADHRRGVDLLRWDLDALEEASAQATPTLMKVQAAGPWTLTSQLELPRGHRVLTDRGALRDFTESLTEGLRTHIADVERRTGASVVVQLDEPGLPAVLAGAVPTPSGYGTVPAVAEPEARELLASVISGVERPVVVHCCAAAPPISLLRSAGATGVAFDLSLVTAEMFDTVGEAWDSGTVLFLGVVPGVANGRVELKDAALPAFRLAERVGFSRSVLESLAVATPACGLAGASAAWARRALGLVRDVGRSFVEPPAAWFA